MMVSVAGFSVNNIATTSSATRNVLNDDNNSSSKKGKAIPVTGSEGP
jgi:hypothetical protein